jgi:tetratricopeptide (TPR) repeat protein
LDFRGDKRCSIYIHEYHDRSHAILQSNCAMISPPDSFHLSAAIGWFELGNHLEANEELEKIVPTLRASIEVLSVRLEIYKHAKKWAEVYTIAETLMQQQPQVEGHWLNMAYAARRKKGGSIEEARAILQKAFGRFPKAWLISFNLSCYESQLGNLESAKEWLDKAFEIGERKQIQQMVLEDPDLEPLRKKYKLL